MRKIDTLMNAIRYVEENVNTAARGNRSGTPAMIRITKGQGSIKIYVNEEPATIMDLVGIEIQEDDNDILRG